MTETVVLGLVYVLGVVACSLIGGLRRDPSFVAVALFWPAVIVMCVMALVILGPYHVAYRLVTGEWPE